MAFLSPNKDSSRTHQIGQKHHFQTCLPDSSRFSTYRNISLAQASDQQSLPIDTPRSFDDKYENIIISPMICDDDDSVYNPGGAHNLLDVTPIEIVPLSNLENLTPVKYSSLDLSDLSFSSLNESLEGLENVPSASNAIETPSVGRLSHGFPTRRREYVLSKRPLGALGVAGTITTSTPSLRGIRPKGRASLVSEGRTRDVFNSSLPLTKAPDSRAERRKTIHSTRIFSPPKKVQRSESTPDEGNGTRPRGNSCTSVITAEASTPGFIRKAEIIRSEDVRPVPSSAIRAEEECPAESGSNELPIRHKAVVARSISTPSKPASFLPKVKRSAPNILNRKGNRSKHQSVVSSSQGSNHFTPSKFLNNPQSSTPVSKRLRDRRNSLLEEMAFISSPLKFNPSCKKQIFPDDDEEDHPVCRTPPAPQPVLSLETTAEDFQVDFSHIGLDTSDPNPLVSLDTPSKDLKVGFQYEEQLFSPVIRMLVDSPVKPISIQPGQDVQSNYGFSLEDLEGLVFGNDDATLTAANGDPVQPVRVRPEEEGTAFYIQGAGVETPDLYVENAEGRKEYFVCNDGTTFVVCPEGGRGRVYGLVGSAFDVVQPGGCGAAPVSSTGAASTSLNVTDVIENDLPDTFMKVVCCETTHSKSLIQQAREVLGVAQGAGSKE